MRMGVASVAVLAGMLAAAMALPAAAQDEKKGKGRFGQRPGGGMPGGFRAGGAAELLGNPDVQKELDIKDDEKNSLTLMKQDNEKAFKSLMEESKELPWQERMGKVREFGKEVDKQIAEILGDKRFERFKQIQLQVGGMMAALMNPEVSEKLGVSEEQRGKFRDAMMGLMREMPRQDRGGGGADDPEAREARTKMFAEMRVKQEAKIKELMTDAQKSKWNEMIGAPITFKLPTPEFRGAGGTGGTGGDRPMRKREKGGKGGKGGDKAPETAPPEKAPPAA